MRLAVDRRGHWCHLLGGACDQYHHRAGKHHSHACLPFRGGRVSSQTPLRKQHKLTFQDGKFSLANVESQS